MKIIRAVSCTYDQRQIHSDGAIDGKLFDRYSDQRRSDYLRQHRYAETKHAKSLDRDAETRSKILRLFLP
jgi:hypothetical protein